MKSKKIMAVALLTSGLFIGSTTSAIADESPAPVSSQSDHQNKIAAYQLAMAQYKIDLMHYRVTLISNDIAYRAVMEKYWSDWNTTVTNYWASWEATIATFRTANVAYLAKLTPIRATRKAALDAAGAAFLSATAGTQTNDALNAALTAYWNANKAANAAYKSAVALIGTEPVRPVQPAKLVRPVAPVKPVDPIKPVAPVKPFNK